MTRNHFPGYFFLAELFFVLSFKINLFGDPPAQTLLCKPAAKCFYFLEGFSPTVGFLLQLMECCVNALVTSFKETILAECPGMIKRNETESEYGHPGRPSASTSLTTHSPSSFSVTPALAVLLRRAAFCLLPL